MSGPGFGEAVGARLVRPLLIGAVVIIAVGVVTGYLIGRYG